MHEFADCQINYQDEQSSHVEQEDQPRNPIPMNVIEWEHTFDRHDIYKKKEAIKLDDYIEINIGTDEEPKKYKNWKRYF